LLQHHAVRDGGGEEVTVRPYVENKRGRFHKSH
jgi:hypothetical protein